MAYAPLTDADYPNIVNMTKSLAPDGSIADVAELLAQSDPGLQDIPVVEGNLPTGHRSTIRADLPTPTWRKLYKGVKPTKSKKIQVEDSIGMLEDYAGVDKDLAMLNGNTAAFRLSEDVAHIEGMAQAMSSTLWYGDTSTNPERYLGLAPRYDAIAISAQKPGATVQSAQLSNVISLGGSANLTSVWLIVWGTSTVFGIYPKGSKAGMLHEDQGESRLSDDDGGWFQGYVSHYQWKMGLVVKDWRCVVRICNIDTSKIEDSTTQKALYTAMIRALHTLPPGAIGRKMFYAAPAISAMLDLAAVEKSNNYLTMKTVFGEELNAFRGVPIRQSNSILETETAVS